MPVETGVPVDAEDEVEQAEEAAAVWCPMGRLRPWEGNPRKNAAAVRRVADSLKRFGWGAVILAREENGEMVAGHTRFAAAELLCAQYPRATVKQREKWHPDAVRTATGGHVPVRFGNWSEREAHLLAIADNKLNELAEWDNEQLAQVLNQFSLGEADAAGFDSKELAKLFESLGQGSEKSTGPVMGTGLKYSVLVECADEQQQSELLERLEAEGLGCKPIIS